MKLAVPISMADAPTIRNSIASLAVMMPPSPTTGIFTACATCHTMRSATGFTAGPDSPPVAIESTGFRRSMSTAMPISVLMSETLSAPSASQARAMSAMFVTLGESFTMSVLR